MYVIHAVMAVKCFQSCMHASVSIVMAAFSVFQHLAHTEILSKKRATCDRFSVPTPLHFFQYPQYPQCYTCNGTYRY